MKRVALGILIFSVSACGPVVDQLDAKIDEPSKGCRLSSGCVALAWDPVTTLVDGSPVQIQGYKIYWGQSSRLYTNSLDVGNKTTATVENLNPGANYFAVTAYVANAESDYSEEVSASAKQPSSPGPQPIVPIIPNVAELMIVVPEYEAL